MSVETMKLSAAIREGAKLRPQAYNLYFSVGENPEQITSCALGAALEACNERVRKAVAAGTYDALAYYGQGVRVTFPELRLPIKSDICPANADCDGIDPEDYITWPLTLLQMISHLNDYHRWTREHIADWLEGRGL